MPSPAESAAKSRRPMNWYLLAAAVPIVVAAVLVVGSLAMVDDWSRDLTQNTAQTSIDAADLRLRPLDWKLSPAQAADAVERAGATLRGWRTESRSAASDGRSIELRLTRRTPLLRFVDDVLVRIEPTDAGSRVNVESRSRVGRGDLGQNPRNIRELLDELQTAAP